MRIERHSPSQEKLRKRPVTPEVFDKFYKNEERFIKDRSSKQEEAKKRKEEVSFSFKPKIKDYSPTRGVTRKKEERPVWERLYGLSSSRNGLHESGILNTPTKIRKSILKKL